MGEFPWLRGSTDTLTSTSDSNSPSSSGLDEVASGHTNKMEPLVAGASPPSTFMADRGCSEEEPLLAANLPDWQF